MDENERMSQDKIQFDMSTNDELFHQLSIKDEETKTEAVPKQVVKSP